MRKPEISIAPMMDWTDRHCRYFLRLISPHVRLYTEMVTAPAILRGDRDRLLGFNSEEHPVALQLGGSDKSMLAEAAKIGEGYGYDEINLNCGCPSDRVQEGRFGACLMKEPDHVADCVEAMQKAVKIPVTVKSRIGIDDFDDFEFLDQFVSRIADKGCTTFIIHARKAWLKGLSPKENREIPVLDYGRAASVKEKYPHLRIIVNGGIKTAEETIKHLQTFDGVMIGREAYQNPWILADIEKTVFGFETLLAREVVAERMAAYAKDQNNRFGTPVKSITRHILGLFHNQPGGKAWRRSLSTLPYKDGADESVIFQALESIQARPRQAA